jgi:hypothetical protein
VRQKLNLVKPLESRAECGSRYAKRVMNALVFLYKQALGQILETWIDVIRANKNRCILIERKVGINKKVSAHTLRA